MIRFPTSKLSESEWQDLRATFSAKGMVGGSDASTLLGLNPYKSPINMFYQAIGLVNKPNKMNLAMLQGKILEDHVANLWQYYDPEMLVDNFVSGKKTRTYRKVKALLVNPKYPSLFANIDGEIKTHPSGRKKGVLEVKTISGYASDMWEAGFPPGYVAQINLYMLVGGYKWGEIVYMKDGRDIDVVTFEANPELQGKILNAANEFKLRVDSCREAIAGLTEDQAFQVACQYEPDADDTKAFADFISERHKARESEGVIHAEPEHVVWAEEYVRLKKQIKELESEQTLLANRLKQIMQQNTAAIMILPEGKITWRRNFTVS